MHNRHIKKTDREGEKVVCDIVLDVCMYVCMKKQSMAHIGIVEVDTPVASSAGRNVSVS